MAHGLGNAQRQRDSVGDEKGPEPQADGHRQLLDNQFPDRLVVEEASAEVELHEAHHHLEEAFVHGLVKAIKGLDLFKLLGVDARAPAVDTPGGLTHVGTSSHARHRGARTTMAGLLPFQGLHHLLDRAARHELNEGEGDQQNAQQGGHHEQDPLDDVTSQGGVQRDPHHQAVMAQSSE